MPSLLKSTSDLHFLIVKNVATAFALRMPITLERGVATIPLKGIDVPFHSSHLRQSVSAYRTYLQEHIPKEQLNVDKLLHRYIPNLTARPFSIDDDYLRDTWRLTGSEVLRELVEPVAA